jgi:hypothetical protein
MPNGIMPTGIMRFLDREEAARLIALSKRRDGGLAVVTGRRRVREDAALVEWVERSGGVYFVADQSSTEFREGLELVRRGPSPPQRHHGPATRSQGSMASRARPAGSGSSRSPAARMARGPYGGDVRAAPASTLHVQLAHTLRRDPEADRTGQTRRGCRARGGTISPPITCAGKMPRSSKFTTRSSPRARYRSRWVAASCSVRADASTVRSTGSR